VEQVLTGHGAPADTIALAILHAYLLLNLGVHAAMVGLAARTAQVAGAAADGVTTLAERACSAAMPSAA
jgi:hypothetical protein